MDNKSIDQDISETLGFVFGNLADVSEYDWIQVLIFSLFCFLIPLLLMNMMIAILSDSYERIQSNAVSADAKAMADMLLEIEQIV